MTAAPSWRDMRRYHLALVDWNRSTVVEWERQSGLYLTTRSARLPQPDPQRILDADETSSSTVGRRRTEACCPRP
jgi:hypothetical protein